MTLSEAIGILILHRKWEKGVDIVKISQEDLQLAMDTITELVDTKLLVGTTPNAWDLFFVRKLQIELDKIPFRSGIDDGGFLDGKLSGFEEGAEWVWNNFKLEIK